MGIKGLLPLLKDIQRKTSVSLFHGKVVGIDAYCWLHKGVYGCAKDVVEGKKTNVYINYVLKRINMLLNYNITPILVFDGGYLPAKASKEKERRTSRENNLKKAKAFLRAGNNTAAFECFQRCVNISPAMATEVIQACREKNVLCIVAPYEADAQLAYLEMQGITNFTITEDSDLLIYGCKKVLFKMNSDGDGILIDLADLNKVKTVALESFTMEKFRHMCILSGCDYLPSVKGLGLSRAYKFIRKSTTVYKAIQLIGADKKLNVPQCYAENFRKTDAVFKYQSVFDPRSKKIVRLNEISDSVTDEELLFAGPEMSEEKAMKIALGNIDPISGETLADFDDFVKSQKPKETTETIQTFTEQPMKTRNPNLEYALDDESFETSDSEFKVEEEDLSTQDTGEESEDETRNAKRTHFATRRKGDNSLLEKSLRSIYMYEQKNPSPSLGVLYDDYRKKEPVASTFGHRGVFVKRNRHKLKNPFRVDEDDNEDDGTLPRVVCRSGYFGKKESKEDKENEISSSKDSDAYPDSDNESNVIDSKQTDSNDTSPPPSKRKKLSFIEYLDSHSKISLKREASKLSDGDSPSSSPEVAVKSREALNLEDHVDVNGNQEVLKPKLTSNNGLPRLPSLPDLKDSDFGHSEKTNKGQLSLSKFMFLRETSKVESKMIQKGRISLFKTHKSNDENETIDKNNSDKELSQDSETIPNRENCFENESLLLSQISMDDEQKSYPISASSPMNKEGKLHLQCRSNSEPILEKSSSTRSLLGRCKKIGLTRKSKSSLDRVRAQNPNLTQSKIGFDRFAYTKKKMDWRENQNDDAI